MSGAVLAMVSRLVAQDGDYLSGPRTPARWWAAAVRKLPYARYCLTWNGGDR